MRHTVAVIGGGAAGLAAAVAAAERADTQVTVLEASPRVGRKLLATGNGRCNLCNVRPAPYHGDGAFAKTVLKNRDDGDVLAFFDRLGLVTAQEEGGRVYPACGQATAVLDVLRNAAAARHAVIRCDSPVTGLKNDGNGFMLTLPGGTLRADSVILAFGGMAGKNLGHDGGAYRLAAPFGHTIRTPSPALVPLETEKSPVRGLSGLRLPVILTLCADGKALAAQMGEILFTDYGVSGVCVMQLSALAGECLQKGQKPVLYVDFSCLAGLAPREYGALRPAAIDRNVPAMTAFLRARAETLPREQWLCGVLPRVLCERFPVGEIEKTARQLCAYPIPVTGLRGMEYAQVTRGGLETKDFSPVTMESRLRKGLFAAGEALNVDGDCGGYNLLFAFASGLIAGENA